MSHNSIIKNTSAYAKDRGKVCIAAKMFPSKKSPLVGEDNIFGADGYMERDTASTILKPAALRAAREIVNDNASISLTVVQRKAKSDRCTLLLDIGVDGDQVKRPIQQVVQPDRHFEKDRAGDQQRIKVVAPPVNSIDHGPGGQMG